MSDGAAGRPAATESTVVTSVSMSTCSALVRLTSFLGSVAFWPITADVPRPMVSAAQRPTMPLIFFMPLSRMFLMPLSRLRGDRRTADAVARKVLKFESADHRDPIANKSNNQHAIIAAPARVHRASRHLPVTHGTGRYPGHPARRRSRRTSVSPDTRSRQTGGVLRGAVPDHRFHAQQLHQFGAAPYLHRDAVQ